MTSYGILTNLPPCVYHPPNVLAGTDPTSYSRLHFLPECHITHYGWFTALLQYVPTGLLGDVAQHAEGAVYTKGLETHMKQWATTSLSIVRMLEGKTVSALLAEREEQHPVYYRLRLSVKLAPGTSWFDALANAPRSKFAHVLVNGIRKIVPRSLLAVPRPRHLYVMVVYRVLRYLWGLETLPDTPLPLTSLRGDVVRKHIIYFDLPKPVRKMLYNDLVQNVEHLPIHSCFLHV
jgi:hypothetical protein